MDRVRALRQAQVFERFWDALVAGQPARPTDELDPDVVAVARRLHALDRPMTTDATFAANLWEDLMHTHAITASIPLRPALLPHGNGRAPTSAPSVPAGPQSGTRTGRRWAFNHVVAAAFVLLLLLAGGILALRLGWPDSGGRTFSSIPAPQVSPEATPPAGPVEFLWETRGDPASPLGNPSHIAVAPDGSIWVVDADNNRFQIFAPDGTFLEAWGESGSGEGQFDFTASDWNGYDQGAIAFAPDGSFYVAEPGNHRVQKFGPDRGFLLAWGSEGSGPGQFGTPIDLVVDGQGRVYVVDSVRYDPPADAETGAVQVFDADGRFLAEWGPRGSEHGQINEPFGIELDPADGTLIVVEVTGSRVQRFTPEGESLDVWGGYGSTDGVFSYPLDAAVDEQGRVFVTDYYNSRVQVFDRDGRFLSAWGDEYGRDPGQFASALAVAVGPDGTVYVSDAGKRLQAFRVGALPAPAATPST